MTPRNGRRSGVSDSIYVGIPLLFFEYYGSDGDVICDAEGKIVVLDKWCLRLLWDGRVSVLAGSLQQKKGHVDSAGTYARFRNPSRITLDERGRILVLDTPSKGGYQRTTCVRVVDAGLKAHNAMQQDMPVELPNQHDMAVLADVEVVVQDMVFHLHAWVLAFKSAFFLKALTSGMREEMRVIKLQDTRVGVFNLLTAGLYDRLSLDVLGNSTDDDLIDLVALADTLIVEDVKKQCMDFFQLSMSLENIMARTSAVYSRSVVSLYAVVSQFFTEYYWELKVSVTTRVIFACMLMSLSMTLFYYTRYKPLGGDLPDRDSCIDAVIFMCSCCGSVLLVTSWN